MRNFIQSCRKSVVACVLMLALAYSVSAGEIPFPGITAQPPAPVTTNGDVQYPNGASPSETEGEIPYPGATVDSVTGMAVTLWQSAMALF
jgi:hypothetical protein